MIETCLCPFLYLAVYLGLSVGRLGRGDSNIRSISALFVPYSPNNSVSVCKAATLLTAMYLRIEP